MNKIIPSGANLYYCVVDSNGNKLISCQSIVPGTTLIDNSDEIVTMTGVIRGNSVSLQNYIIENGINPVNFVIPEYIPKLSWLGQNANSIDTIFRIDCNYFLENIPIANFTINLSSPSNDVPFDGGNNQYLLQLINYFSNLGLIYTALIHE
jgi:hypothetical protein